MGLGQKVVRWIMKQVMDTRERIYQCRPLWALELCWNCKEVDVELQRWLKEADEKIMCLSGELPQETFL